MELIICNLLNLDFDDLVDTEELVERVELNTEQDVQEEVNNQEGDWVNLLEFTQSAAEARTVPTQLTSPATEEVEPREGGTYIIS